MNQEPTSEFRIERARDGARELVRPLGDLDLATADGLTAAVEAAVGDGADRVLVDLSGVSFIDSSGLRVILRLAKAARDGRFVLSLRPAPPRVHRVFELAGMVDTLPFEGP